MLVDGRWLILIIVSLAIVVIVRHRKEWAEPLLVATAVATVLITVLFFIAVPMFVPR